jgi:FlaA1/EpsC-like NDP-sugar epimerase
VGESRFGFRRFVVFALQLGLIVGAATLAHLLRFDFDSSRSFDRFLPFLLLALCVKLPIFHSFRLNRGWWRYTSLSDMLAILKAVALSQFLFGVAYWISESPYFPRSIFVMDFFLTLLFLGGVRLIFRWVFESNFQSLRRRRKSDGRVLIVGAGDGGIALLRHLKQSHDFSDEVVGFVDDLKRKVGTSFHGVPILGTIDELSEIAREKKISEVFIAIPSLRKSALQRIIDKCIEAKVPFKTIPSLREIIELGASAHKLREVKVEDLLGREPIQLDKTKTLEEIRGASVLVTGAGGSIGSELCRQILCLGPRQLILFERSEYNLFEIKRELRRRNPEATLISIVGDVLDRSGLEAVFHQYRPDLVYHAAAHKHVHLMELSPREAIRNNVFGTRNIAEVSAENGVKKFVMISTDKAVNPLSVMGYSKRMAELVIQSLAGSKTEFISVRFGNVLGSSGSAVEIFRKQISAGGPVTVTHRDASRFFMTTPEAVELVLHAGSHGQSGHIYMLDMGQPVKIMDLATKMIQLADPEGRREIKIEVTGLWPGEKIREELVWQGEDFIPSPIEKVFTLKNRVNPNEVPIYLKRLQHSLDTPEASVAAELKQAVDAIDSKVRQSSREPHRDRADLRVVSV